MGGGFAFVGKGAGGLPAARALSLASGVLVSADGLVVTHSPEAGSGKYTVYLADGRSLPARVLVDDQRNGLRLLKVDAEGLPSVALAEAEAEVGDPVIAGFCTDRRGRAAAQGMVAAEYRAAIGGPVLLDLTAGRMSTGGPVVDGAGRLVGVLSGKRDNASAASSAVPLDAVRGLVQARQGENIVVVPRGYLGIQLESKVDGGREHIVARLLPESPAGAGGMVDGDEIVAVDGEHVASPGEVAGAVARHTAGEKVRVAVLREGAEQKLELVVGLPAALPAVPGTPARVPPATREVNVVRPEQLYVMTEDGKWRAIALTGTQLEPLLAHIRQHQSAPATGGGGSAAGGVGSAAGAAEPAPNVIRVERSDLEQKLEAVGRNVQSLEQQLQKLTEEIKSLRTKLAE